MATTFARLNRDQLQFTKSGSVFATIATDANADTIKFTAAGGVGELFVSGVKTPTLGTHAANKSYVDSVAQGLDVKKSVRCATTVAIVLSTELADGSVVDGVTLATGDRVLVKNQTDVAENGIYVVKASGTPDRAVDLGAGARAAGAFVFVESGTNQQDSGFVCTTDSNVDTVGTDTLEWTAFSGAGAFTAGVGLTKTGSTFDVNGQFGTTDLSTTGDITARSLTCTTTVNAAGITASGTVAAAAITASGTLAVTGHASLGTLAASNTAIDGTVHVTGNSDLDGTLDLAGSATLGGTLSVASSATLSSTCDVLGDFAVVGAGSTDTFTVAAATGNTAVKGTLGVDGTLSVDGNTTVGSAFSVDAATGDCSANSYISTSDRTLKQDIVTIPAADALGVVMSMRPVTFAFIRNPSDPRVGVIAQEMREVAPAIVKDVSPPESSGIDTHLAVNYGDLTAYLIGAIQALQAQVVALQAKQCCKQAA